MKRAGDTLEYFGLA